VAQPVLARDLAQRRPEILPYLLGQVQQVTRVLIRDQEQVQPGPGVGVLVRGDGPVPGPQQDLLAGEPVRAEQADARRVEAGISASWPAVRALPKQ